MTRLMRIILPKTLTRSLSAFGLFLACLWQALPKSSLRRLSGLQEHISLEIVSMPDKLHFCIWTPYHAVASIVAAQIRAHFPEVLVDDCADEMPLFSQCATAELRLGLSRERPLRTLKDSQPDPTSGMLASLSRLSHGEWGTVQFLVRPALAPELDTQAFQVVIRVAATSHTARSARNRLGSIIAAFGQFAERNALKPTNVRVNSMRAMQMIYERRWPPFGRHHSILTRDELASMYHFPSPAEMHSRHLDVTAARRLPALSRPPDKGVRVGLALLDGSRREMRLTEKALLRHMLLLGATGTGKSTLVLNLTHDLINLGHGVTVFDPHGGLVSMLLPRIPARRMDDVILLRFSDVAHPVGLNFLTAKPGFEFLIVDELVEICQRIYSTSYWGPVLDLVLRHAAYAVLETGGTLLEMARILDDDAYRRWILPRVQNPETRRFLERLDEYRPARREQYVASTLNRLQRFLGTPFIRNIVGQQKSTIDVRRIMDQRRILLVDLSGIGVDNAKFLGSLLTLLFRQAALSRENIPESDRVPHFLTMDECSWFISRSVGEMADQMRKFGLGLVLAAQRVSQLKPNDTRDAVLSNVSNTISFRMGDIDDARLLERHLNTPGLVADDIRSLGQYEIYAQLLRNGAKMPAFWAQTPPPPAAVHGGRRRAEAIVQRSREMCARPREIVEREIAQRGKVQTHAEPEKRHR